MMKCKVVLPSILLALVIASALGFQTRAFSQPLTPMLKMVVISVDSPAQVRKLASMGIDIAAVRKPGAASHQIPGKTQGSVYRVEAVISKIDEKKLKGAGFTWKEMPMPSGQTRHGESVYHSFDEPDLGIRAQLEQIAQRYPGLARLETFGYSIQNRPMLAMCITAGGGSRFAGGLWQVKKPEVLFLATHHAREWVATQMAMRLINYLVENFGTVDRVSRLLMTTEVWVVPVANPDGYEYTFTNERLWRKNLRDNDGDGVITVNDGVDINRNFDSYWGLDEEGATRILSDATYRGTAPHSEPETQAAVDFIRAHDFKFIVSYHTYGNLILYAWGWQVQTPSLDDPIYVAQSGTPENPAIRDTIVDEGYVPGVGADLYIVNGDFADWCYEKEGIPAYIVEMTAGYDREDNDYGFVFPDNEEMVQTVFEDNLNFALSLTESAKDPAHPVSPVGMNAEDSRHTPVAISWGPGQVIEVLARKGLELNLSYTINGGDTRTAGFEESLGSWYNDMPGVYYSNYRAVISGQAAGDVVRYTVGAGENTLGPHEYTVAVATGNPVLIVSAEDYTGESPSYEDTSGPHYLNYYTDALDAAGYGYDVWDVSVHEAAPSPIDVLSHYDSVIWYTGDDWEATVPDPGVHEDMFLGMRDFMNYDGGKLLATGQDLAYQAAVAYEFSDDFFQYSLGSYIHVEEGGMNPETQLPYTVAGEDEDPVFGGMTFDIHGGDGAGNQFYADSFLVTRYFLPHFDVSVGARYNRPGGPYDPHSGAYYVYSQMADYSYKRLGGTFTLPEGDPVLRFWVSYNLETDWDYAFVEIREAGQDDWTTLPDQNGLTARETGESCLEGWVEQIHPFLGNYMDADCNPSGTTGEWHAFNGNSSGWRQVRMDLSAYAGKTVEIYIASASDWGFQNLGVFVDDVEISGYPIEDFEEGMGNFAASTAQGSIAVNNWLRMEGANFPDGAAIVSPNSVYLGFGFEGIDTASNRTRIMQRVMQYFMP